MDSLLFQVLVTFTILASCIGERCWWQAESFCQNRTCEDTHNVWLSFDSSSKLSAQLRCPKGEGQDVVLCERPGLAGECYTTHIAKGQDCANVDPKINILASSIHLLGGCIRVYDEANCQGKPMVLDKEGDFFNLADIKDMVISVGLCPTKDRSKREDNRASPKGRVRLRTPKMICYTFSGRGVIKFTPVEIDSKLCTHIFYDHAILKDNLLSEKGKGESRRYLATTALKQKNPNLKVLLAGRTGEATMFQELTSTKYMRNRFIYNTIEFLRKCKFDGLDVDWLTRDVGDEAAAANLLKELGQAFEGEADTSGEPRLLLTASLDADFILDAEGYAVPGIVKYLEFINVLTYRFLFNWGLQVESKNIMNSSDDFTSYQQSVNYGVKELVKMGVPKEKLMIGMTTYGLLLPESYELSDKFFNSMMPYPKICGFLRDKNTEHQWSDEMQIPFASRGAEEVTYEDEKSLKIKVDWLKKEGYGGVTVWWLDLDDFKGTCGSEKFPLLNAIGKALDGYKVKLEYDRPFESQNLDSQKVSQNSTQGTATSQNCTLSKTIINGKRVCRNSVIFNDDFRKFDLDKWRHEIKIARKPDYEFIVYNDKPENAFVKNGSLHLKPTVNSKNFVETGNLSLDRCTGDVFDNECSGNTEFFILPPVQSAWITTRQKLKFKYGLVEVQAKFPAGDWITADIRLVPADHTYGPQYESGLVRIVSRGNVNLKKPNGEDIGSQTVEASVMLGSGTNVKAKSDYYRRDSGWQNEFHNFTIIWTPEDIAFLVDGNARKNIMRNAQGSLLSDVVGLPRAENKIWSTGTSIAPFDQPFYLSLGVSVGGIRNFEDEWSNNGKSRPWSNTDSRAMLSFWRKRDEWQPTWERDAAFKIKSVKIKAL